MHTVANYPTWVRLNKVSKCHTEPWNGCLQHNTHVVSTSIDAFQCKHVFRNYLDAHFSWQKVQNYLLRKLLEALAWKLWIYSLQSIIADVCEILEKCTNTCQWIKFGLIKRIISIHALHPYELHVPSCDSHHLHGWQRQSLSSEHAPLSILRYSSEWAVVG